MMSNDTTSVTKARRSSVNTPRGLQDTVAQPPVAALVYLLDHDYKEVCLEALHLLPPRFFRSELRDRLRWKETPQCYIPAVEGYTAPFVKTGFEVLRSDHFCWVPHFAGKLKTALFIWMSPVLKKIARSRAMRSLVVARKPY